MCLKIAVFDTPVITDKISGITDLKKIKNKQTNNNKNNQFYVSFTFKKI